MSNWLSRTEMLLGTEKMNRLRTKRVAVFGLGGVGGYVCEALARSGIGAFDLVDNDTISESNRNRQIIATTETVGRLKTEVMRDRILSINPEADVRIHTKFFLPENAAEFPFDEFDFIVDAIDTVTAKLELIMQADARRIPIISSMGTGNKLDPTRFRVSDISKTSMDPLARVMRRELGKRGIKKLTVVWSDEPPIDISANLPDPEQAELKGGRIAPGSSAFVPPAAGLVIAGEVIRKL